MKTTIHHLVIGTFVLGSLFTVACGGGEKKDDKKTETPPSKDSVTEVKEVEPKLYQGYMVNEKDFAGGVYIATKKETIAFDKLGDYFNKHYPKMFELAEKAGHTPAGATIAVYYSWDTTAKTAELQAAIPVMPKGDIKIKGYEKLELSGAKCLHIEYYGAYEKSEMAHMGMDEYMVEKGLSQSMVIEEYVTDPMVEKDTSKWLTNIFYILK